MYKALTEIARYYGVSTSFIKNNFGSRLEEGKHYIFIGKLKKFNIKEMGLLLTSKPEQREVQKMLQKFEV